ncbi:MAG TPA: cation:proton antiporter [Gemmatimonadaceae bacterium]|nr:cation:proton antiporter [Gemmatimonadaceae bacterium]
MHDIAHLLLVVAVVIFATKLFGNLAQRIGQPAVLGELVAGVVLGASMFGVLDPADPVIASLAELGVIVLLFEIGLHTDLRSLLAVGSTAGVVGIVGVVLPFAAGYLVSHALGLDVLASIMCGAALTATSIGISARVLADLGQLQTMEGQVVLGAAVLDDVVGLVILAVVSAMAGGATVSPLGIAKTAAIAIGFVVVALLLGGRLAPPAFRLVERFDSTGQLGLVGLVFALLLAYAAATAGSAMIIGAFAAGLILHDLPARPRIEAEVTALGRFFVPFFFASVGAAVNLKAMGGAGAWGIMASLLAVGILSKFVAGYAPWWFRGSKALVGVAMVPRGEVGLIFAQIGLATESIGVDLFSAITLVVMATTFVAPPLLGYLVRSRAVPAGASTRSGNIAELVVGAGVPGAKRRESGQAAGPGSGVGEA